MAARPVKVDRRPARASPRRAARVLTDEPCRGGDCWHVTPVFEKNKTRRYPLFPGVFAFRVALNGPQRTCPLVSASVRSGAMITPRHTPRSCRARPVGQEKGCNRVVAQ